MFQLVVLFLTSKINLHYLQCDQISDTFFAQFGEKLAK